MSSNFYDLTGSHYQMLLTLINCYFMYRLFFALVHSFEAEVIEAKHKATAQTMMLISYD